MSGWRRDEADKVPPELVDYIKGRDGGCVVAILGDRLEILVPTPCRDRYGTPVDGRFVARSAWDRVLTLAHVRDRRGGRTGKRPPSTPRRLAAVCAGHALPPDNFVDRADVRPVVDRYLESREGPDRDETRPWERIRRVRAADS